MSVSTLLDTGGDIPPNLDLWADQFRCNSLHVQLNEQVDGDLQVDGTINGGIFPVVLTLEDQNPASPGLSLITQSMGPHLKMRKIHSTGTNFAMVNTPDLSDIDLSLTGVVPASYGDGYNVSTVTVDAFGRLTASIDTPISDLIGATNLLNGTRGFAPTPLAGEEDFVLFGDGLWASPLMSGATALLNGASGSVPAPLAGEEAYVLFGDGTWGPDSTPIMVGATALLNGASGSVPAPLAGEEAYVLFGDGTWGPQVLSIPITFIGAAETYTTVGAALTAGFYNLYINDGETVFEVAPIIENVISSIMIRIGLESVWDLQSNLFTHMATAIENSSLTVLGMGKERSILAYADTFAFENANAASNLYQNWLYLENITIVNSSTLPTQIVFNQMYASVKQCRLVLPNVNQGGFGWGVTVAPTSGYVFIVDDLEIVGGGILSNSPLFIYASGSISMNNVRINGDFLAAGAVVLDLGSNLDVVSNFTIESPGPTECHIQGVITNIRSNGGGQSDIYIGGTSTAILDTVYLALGNIVFNAISTGCNLSEVILIAGNITMAGSSNKVSNVTSGGDLNFIAATLCKADNSSFENIVVDGTSNNNSMIGCTAGTGLTITVDLGATNNIILGCFTDIALVDNGTTTTKIANIVY